MYNREKAVAYAHKWAFGRNPAYYDFHGIGGDCTSFVSQCLYAGSGVMNYTPTIGWYYISLQSRSASWSGVTYFYNFMVSNQGRGPYGHEAPLEQAEIGDVIQLSFDGTLYVHSLLVVHTETPIRPQTIRIATHTLDSDNRPLSTYLYQKHRLIHIDGARK